MNFSMILIHAQFLWNGQNIKFFHKFVCSTNENSKVLSLVNFGIEVHDFQIIVNTALYMYIGASAPDQPFQGSSSGQNNWTAK